MKHKHVSIHNGNYVWQVTLLGHPLRSGAHYPAPEEAACSCQLFKHYLKSEFRLLLPESLDGEMFAALAYRLNVDLSNSHSVFMALTDSAKQFITTQRAALEAHKEAHPESTADKFRRSGAMNSPQVREWVDKLDAATKDANDFAEIDGRSFATRLEVSHTAMGTALRSLRVASRMHEGVTNPRLVERARIIAELLAHFEASEAHIRFLAVQFAEEASSVSSAVALLESARPPLV